MPKHFLVATFRFPEDVVKAVRKARNEDFRIYDVYSPYPIHGLDRAMGIRRTRIPLIALLGGLFGLVFAVSLQFYTTVLDWPMNVGGKPDNSALAFVPICFELTVLFSGLVTVLALFVRSRLFPGKQECLIAEGTTDGTFAVVLRKRPSTDIGRARVLLESCGAYGIEEKAANL